MAEVDFAQGRQPIRGLVPALPMAGAGHLSGDPDHRREVVFGKLYGLLQHLTVCSWPHGDTDNFVVLQNYR